MSPNERRTSALTINTVGVFALACTVRTVRVLLYKFIVEIAQS